MIATVETIEKRMSRLSDTPAHSNSPITAEDIPEIMSEYERLVHKATIGPVVQIDTSIDSPQQTLERLIKLLEPHLTRNDRKRIENHNIQVSA